MRRWNRGWTLLLALLVVGCSSPDQDGSGSGMVEMVHPKPSADRLSGLEAEMGQVAQKRAWSGRYFKGRDGAARYVNVSDAVVDGNDLFCVVQDAATRLYELHAIDTRNGTPRWVVEFGSDEPQFSPSAGDRFVTLILARGGGMVVINRHTGARQYRVRTQINQIVPLRGPGSSDSTVYCASLMDNRVHALDPDGGATGWHWRTKGTLSAGPLVTPRLPRRLVVFGTDRGEMVALPTNAWNEVRPRDAAWSRTLLGDVTAQIGVASRMNDKRREVSILVPCEDRGLYCLDVATGASRWVYRSAHAFVSQPRAVGGRVFCRNQMGMQVVDLASGDAAWEGLGGEGCEICPCDSVIGGTADSVWMLTDGDRVLRVLGSDGSVESSVRLSSFDHVPATADTGLLIGLTRDGYVVAYK